MILEERSACLISFLFDRLILHFLMFLCGFQMDLSIFMKRKASERMFSDVGLCMHAKYI
jgi:hypothetical protein